MSGPEETDIRQQIRWAEEYIRAQDRAVADSRLAAGMVVVGDQPETIQWYPPGGPAWHATTGTVVTRASNGTWVTPDHLCPDLLRHANIGAADSTRGRLVRGFFWLMRLWPPKTAG
jgi:hypothetical protein